MPGQGSHMSESVVAHTEPSSTLVRLRYHRLNLIWARAHRLRPLWAVLLAAGIYVAVGLALIVGLVILAEVGVLPQAAISFELDNVHEPRNYLFAFATVALMLPAVFLAFWVVGRRPGFLSSVAGRIRRGWFLRMMLGAAAIWLVSSGATMAWDLITGAQQWEGVRPQGLWLVLVALLITPIQAAAEEYVFRGALAQMVGTWLRHPAWAILLPVPLFVVGHTYEWVGLVDVAIFAVAAGWLTWRTGGLEAAIAMHVVNNTLLGVFGGLGLADLNAVSAPPEALLPSLAPVAIFVAWAEWRVRREDVTNTCLVLTSPGSASASTPR